LKAAAKTTPEAEFGLDVHDYGTPSGFEERQRWFEATTMDVLDRVLSRGERIDLAAAEHLAGQPAPPGEHHVEADLIICVASLRELLRAKVGDDGPAREILNAARHLWDAATVPWNDAVGRERTRVQVCIGNIRRALNAAAEG